jgi:hypothetical protein
MLAWLLRTRHSTAAEGPSRPAPVSSR